MNLQQINVEYIAEHDRVLLRIAVGGNEEVLLWLTRRCVRLLWPGLVGLAQTAPEIATQSHPDAKAALLGMRHEEALSKADFSKPYDASARNHPLGSEPILVARMQARKDDKGAFVLTLLPAKGQGVNVALDEALLHSLCRLLMNVVGKADWDMKLDWPKADEQPGPARVLN